MPSDTLWRTQSGKFDMVFIVLVNWNGGFDTIQCLESIFRSTYKNFKVIVVDNFSQDDSIEVIRAWAELRLCIAKHGSSKVELLSFPPVGLKIPYVQLEAQYIIHQNASKDACDMVSIINNHQLFIVTNSKNAGFGAGNNIGLALIKMANKCDHVWLLNNDTVIEPDTLSKLLSFSGTYSRTVIGAVLCYYDKPDKIQAAGGGLFSCKTGLVKTLVTRRDTEIDFINGASFFAPNVYFDEVGGFDENIFMYFEENDHCIRGKKLGFSFRCCDAVVYHKIGGSKFGSERAWQQIFTNKFYTMRKHFGFGCWQLFYFGSILINGTKLNRNPAKRRASQFIIRKLFLILSMCRYRF